MLAHVPERRPVARDDRVEDVEVRRVLRVENQQVDRPTLGQPPEPDREDVLEQDREHEDRHRDPDQRHEQTRVVQHPSVVLGRNEAERNPDRHGEDQRGDGELHRRGKPLADLVGDLAMCRDADAEVASTTVVFRYEVLLGPARRARSARGTARRARRRALAEQRLGGAPGSARQTKSSSDRPSRTGTKSNSRRTMKRSISGQGHCPRSHAEAAGKDAGSVHVSYGRD